MGFDHERLDVYQTSIQFVSWVAVLVQGVDGDAKDARRQLVRSSQSIPQNIAEGNGKRSSPDRRRFFEIARGSAMESAATLDVLVAIGTKRAEDIQAGKDMLVRIVQMLVRLAPPE